MYTGKNKMHSSTTSKIRKEIESWIKEKHKTIKWEYGVIKINNRTYRGWQNLEISEK